MIRESKYKIRTIPVLQIESDEPCRGTVLFYHGWTSNKELQRLRGRIFAAYGYRAILPDAIHHGERGTLADYEAPEAYPIFWNAVFENVRESKTLLSYIRTIDDKPIAVVGHSMGGITAMGIGATGADLHAIVSVNGSGYWEKTDEMIRKDWDIPFLEGFDELIQKIKEDDPYRKPISVVTAPILALHGEVDSTVSVLAQQAYYEKKKKEGALIEFITYPKLDHFLTVTMMDEILQFLERHMK